MKKIHTIILISLIYTLTFAQIDLEIGDGMTVETTGGIEIEISGDLNENSTGYLKGTVSSGSRTGTTSFAGLTLSSGFDGTIKRTTGVDFNGVTAPSSVLRSYEMNNSNVSGLTADVEMEIASSETNGLAEKYIYTDDAGTLKGYSDDGSTGSVIKGASVVIPTNISNITVAEGVGLISKIYLEGPYSGGSMADNLGTLPSLSPYAESPRTVSAIPGNAVDWVQLEIRSGTGAGSVIGHRSVFVDVNGNIINDAGAATGVGLPGVGGSSYYVVVKHRNHLPIMSNSAQTLDWLTP